MCIRFKSGKSVSGSLNLIKVWRSGTSVKAVIIKALKPKVVVPRGMCFKNHRR
jgi:hypothetical protein